MLLLWYNLGMVDPALNAAMYSLTDPKCIEERRRATQIKAAKKAAKQASNAAKIEANREMWRKICGKKKK